MHDVPRDDQPPSASVVESLVHLLRQARLFVYQLQDLVMDGERGDTRGRDVLQACLSAYRPQPGHDEKRALDREDVAVGDYARTARVQDRKSTRLNSSHLVISC